MDGISWDLNINQWLTHFLIPLLCMSGGFTPCCQGVDGHKVGVELTVGVGENSSQFGNQLSGTVLTQRFRSVFLPSLQIEQQHRGDFYLVGPQEKSLGVVVIGVNVVPDDRCSSQDSRHLFYRFHRDFMGHHFGTWTGQKVLVIEWSLHRRSTGCGVVPVHRTSIPGRSSSPTVFR